MKEVDAQRRMEKVFDKWQGKFDAATLFERFLEFTIVGFDQTFSPIERPFSDVEKSACMEMFQAWVLGMNEILATREWYDILGEVYQTYIAGKMKKHWTGQYFTPMHISDLMAEITIRSDEHKASIMDNSCGSGRMMLAAHVRHPEAYCIAKDLDRICCLMTVCNFIIHGVNGEVVWGDGLMESSFNAGWRTNELLKVIGVPCARTLAKAESVQYKAPEAKAVVTKRVETVLPKPRKEKPQKVEFEQLTLF